MPLAQLPDSRRAILTELKNRGVATIAQLAGVLQLTGEAVRQQLLQLHREGWVANDIPKGDRHRTGRPASVFRLTPAGDHLFPKSYDQLARNLLAFAGDDPLGHLTEAKVKAGEPSLRDLPLAAKVDALKSLYSSDDPYMSVEATRDGYRLIERNCPYYNVAMENASICSVSVDVLTRLLGVRVEREETFQDGDGRCAFRIFANQPAK
ncbi:MAG TPA: replication-relaxation family protein [Thermoanaerobaculia bacterium]